jgi:hypothetical protein
MLAVLAAAAICCALGVLDRPAAGLQGGKGEQILDLVRVATTAALALSLLLGPGIVYRAYPYRERPLGLAFLPIPGLLATAAVAGLAWLLAGSIEPEVVCFALLGPLLAAMAVALLRGGPEEIFEPEEQRALLVTGCALGLAIARALWSLGPVGELYSGTISHTLEVGDRPDSRISFIIPQLVAHGENPYGPIASNFYAPYNFSSRGPLPGLASTPAVLMSGGRPPGTEFAEQPWAPFDPEGFMAYRIAMMTFAVTAFLALWDLVRRLAGDPAARLGLLLAVTTPFLVHEIWFTWPKMLAAALVLAAAICVIERRPLAGGLLLGLGYLMHPVALLSLPALALLALWPLRGSVLRRPRLAQLLWMLAGLAAFAVLWRLLNGSHYSQDNFLEYTREAGFDLHPGIFRWIEYRLVSAGNTVVPFMLLGYPADHSINVVGGSSPFAVHFFFQYWDGLPFGGAIVFFPLLLVGLWRALRRWAWAVTATVLVPFAIFAVYWGASDSGMLREGLQAWVLSIFAVLACEQAASGFGWLRSTPVRVILVARVVEILAMLALPTLLTRHELLGNAFELSDAVALLAILGFAGALAALVWTARPPAAAAPARPRVGPRAR